MFQKRFLDRDNPPDQNQITEAIGRESLQTWEDTQTHLATYYQDYEREPIYMNPQQGWGVRYRKEAQQLCVIFPERGGFSALLVLNPEQIALAQEKIHFFNARLRELLNQVTALSQGGLLLLRLEDHTDFVGLKLLLEIKSGR